MIIKEELLVVVLKTSLKLFDIQMDRDKVETPYKWSTGYTQYDVLRERSGSAMVVVVAGHQSLDSRMMAHSMGLSEEF